MAAASKADAELFVRAPLVEVDSKDGKRVRLFFGDVVTENVANESVDLLKSLGFVTDKNPRDAAKSDD